MLPLIIERPGLLSPRGGGTAWGGEHGRRSSSGDVNGCACHIRNGLQTEGWGGCSRKTWAASETIYVSKLEIGNEFVFAAAAAVDDADFGIAAELRETNEVTVERIDGLVNVRLQY